MYYDTEYWKIRQFVKEDHISISTCVCSENIPVEIFNSEFVVLENNSDES